jgi:hypothetical protein
VKVERDVILKRKETLDSAVIPELDCKEMHNIIDLGRQAYGGGDKTTGSSDQARPHFVSSCGGEHLSARLIARAEIPQHIQTLLDRSGAMRPCIPNGECYYYEEDVNRIQVRYDFRLGGGVGCRYRMLKRFRKLIKRSTRKTVIKLRRGFLGALAWKWLSGFLTIGVVVFFLLVWLHVLHIPQHVLPEVVEGIGTVYLLIGTLRIGLGVRLSTQDFRDLRRVETGGLPSGKVIPKLLKNASRNFDDGMVLVVIGTLVLLFKLAITASGIAERPEDKEMTHKVESTSTTQSPSLRGGRAGGVRE